MTVDNLCDVVTWGHGSMTVKTLAEARVKPAKVANSVLSCIFPYLYPEFVDTDVAGIV